MAKKPMSIAQKYRRANARGAGPGAEGRAKIATAEMIAKDPKKYDKAGEGTVYGLRAEGSRLLGQDYARKIGGEGEVGMYNKGGKLKMVEKGGKKVPAFAADGVGKMAKGGKISEYGGKEMYKSKSAMMKHEGSESMAMERKERKMAMGGKCRGMGAATKGGNYKG